MDSEKAVDNHSQAEKSPEIFLSELITCGERITEILREDKRTKVRRLGKYFSGLLQNLPDTLQLKNLPIEEVVLVRQGKNTYCFENLSIERLCYWKSARFSVQNLSSQFTIQFDNREYPLIFLSHILGESTGLPEKKNDWHLLLLKNSKQEVFALHVEEILDKQRVARRPLPSYLKNHPYISGVTILPDESPALVLDCQKLAQDLNFTVSEIEKPEISQLEYIFFKAGKNQFSILASQTVHINELRIEDFRSSGENYFYQNEKIPVFVDGKSLEMRAFDEKTADYVIICNSNENLFAILVDKVIGSGKLQDIDKRPLFAGLVDATVIFAGERFFLLSINQIFDELINR